MCGVLSTVQCLTWFCCYCWPAMPKLSSQILVSKRLKYVFTIQLVERVKNNFSIKWTCVFLSRYGASSRHSHRLLWPSLAVISDEWAGEPQSLTNSVCFLLLFALLNLCLGICIASINKAIKNDNNRETNGEGISDYKYSINNYVFISGLPCIYILTSVLVSAVGLVILYSWA